MYPSKAEVKAANTQALVDAGFAFSASNNGECLSFRGDDDPLVDFYPSTGRWYWRLNGRNIKGVTMEGGAEKFIAWYASHTPRKENT